MSARMELRRTAPEQHAAMVKLERSIELEPRLRNLVSLRVSQINGCAFCIDVHWREARSAGESEERLYMLGVWRETALYDERERAALELCAAITRIPEDGVLDGGWARAAQQFDAQELGQLVFAITAINAWNRLAITTRKRPALGGRLPASPHESGPSHQ